MITTTHIILNYPILSGQFTLFKSLFPLEIELLSPWLSVKCFNSLIMLQLIDWSYIDEEVLEKHPHTDIWFPLRWNGGMWRERFVSFGLKRSGRCNISQPPTCFNVIICWLPFSTKVRRRPRRLFLKFKPLPHCRLYPIFHIIWCTDRA